MADAASPIPAAAAAQSSRPAETPGRMRQAAEEFEAVFLAQLLGTLTRGIGGDGPLAGAGGDAYRDMFNFEVAKLISRSGGIGVADVVLQEMLKMQEVP